VRCFEFSLEFPVKKQPNFIVTPGILMKHLSSEQRRIQKRFKASDNTEGHLIRLEVVLRVVIGDNVKRLF